jgi:hypothetical protein
VYLDNVFQGTVESVGVIGAMSLAFAKFKIHREHPGVRLVNSKFDKERKQ